jgi:hypothetical protein
MKKGQRAETDDEGRNPCAPHARQCVFRRRVALGGGDTIPFQGSWRAQSSRMNSAW